MRQGRRYGLSGSQRTDMWRRWKAGESLHEIGRALGKDHGSIQFLLSQHGGIVPAVRRSSLRSLTPRARCTLRLVDSPAIRSSMPSLSGKGLQRLKIVPYPVIGREICSAAPATATSQPWWNDI